MGFVCRRAHKHFAVIDRIPGKTYDDVGHIHFTAAGTAVYTATLNSRQVVVVGSTELAEFDSLLTSLVFDSPSSLHFLATRDGEFFREEIRFDK